MISSHQLSEIEQIADIIGILHEGDLMEECDMSQIAQHNQRYISITVSDVHQATRLLEEALNVTNYTVDESDTIKIFDFTYEPQELNRLFGTNGIAVSSLFIGSDNLEEHFRTITGVLALLNIISAEWMKLKRNRIFAVCSLLALFASAFMVFKDLVIAEHPPENYQTWMMSVYVVVGAVLSILSGFIITFLMQREYEDRTINNVLTAPTSRLRFLMGKLAIWFLWYFGTLIGVVIIYTIGGWLIFANTFGMAGTKNFDNYLAQVLSLRFCSSRPFVNGKCAAAKAILSNNHGSFGFYGDRNVCHEYALQNGEAHSLVSGSCSKLDGPALQG